MEIKALLKNKGVQAALIILASIIILSGISACKKHIKNKGVEPTDDTVDIIAQFSITNSMPLDDIFSTTMKNDFMTEQISSGTSTLTEIEINQTRVSETENSTKTTKANYTINKNEFKTNIEKDFKYSIREGKVIIDSYLGEDKDIKIPAKIGGYPVAAIGNGAFSGIGAKAGQTINSVEIENGLERIESKAFSSCINLKYIKIPDSVGFIGEFAFESCPNLTIKCSMSSYARTFAIEKDIKYMD